MPLSLEMRPNILFAFADDWGRYAHAYAAHENGPSMEQTRTGASRPDAIVPCGVGVAEPDAEAARRKRRVRAHSEWRRRVLRTRPGRPWGASLNQLIETPNFDRIAAEGVLFLNALVPAPSCTPCRSSILAGQYFWQTGLGAILQGAVWDETIPTFPLELEKGGYFVGYQYKVWSPGRTLNAPIGGARTRFEPAGRDFNQFSHWVTANAEGLGIEGAKQALYDETRKNFRAFLAARPSDQPFCYWWGPTNTHRTWERGSGRALWGIEPDHLQGRLPGFLPDVHEIREDAADYLGECLAVDAGLGVLREELLAIGEWDNTLIVVSGDHGIPGMPRAKCNLYDIGCEVALAARWPGRIGAGRVVDDFVNLMDLGPTFCEVGGIETPGTMTGKSLLPILEASGSGQIDPARDHVVTGRERHVAFAREGHLPYPQRSLRTRDFIYIVNFEPDRWPMGDPKGLDDLQAPAPDYQTLASNTFAAYADLDASPTKAWMIHHREDHDVEPLFDLAFGKRPREELYDLAEDPHYLNNVAEDPAYANVRGQMQARLFEILEEQRDPRLMEQPCRYELEPYAGPPPQ